MHDKCVLALSDQQIVTGIAILASAYSQLHRGLSMYHFQMAIYLAWFSTLTHLSTLTFLRRHLDGNNYIRLLRLCLMVVLGLMLAVALIPTGSNCSLRKDQLDWTQYPGMPALCCFAKIGSKGFVYSYTFFLSMISSELVLFVACLTRGIKLFWQSSNFVRKWLRRKPAAIWKRGLSNNYSLIQKHNAGIRRLCWVWLYYIRLTLLLLGRAVYDLAESILWEVCPHFF